ncbi:hypothetical protein TrRE_jg3774 [Triparma retinervis]|uniref:SUN domain-containing protein n=1 Tax=Triparma retinervis TaxID=2557542 RepID=A0A9W7DLW1_9STRA|nr:hypothetical protein TrRE_jg3774 [Triparma retinervis]
MVLNMFSYAEEETSSGSIDDIEITEGTEKPDASDQPTIQDDIDKEPAGSGGGSGEDEERIILNYASTSAGAIVLEKSPNSKGMSNILVNDKDKYALTPCEDKKWVVIGLSEDIQIKTIIMAHYEKFSSTTSAFQLLGSQTFPTQEWRNLGTFTAKIQQGEQKFEVSERALAR